MKMAHTPTKTQQEFRKLTSFAPPTVEKDEELDFMDMLLKQSETKANPFAG